MADMDVTITIRGRVEGVPGEMELLGLPTARPGVSHKVADAHRRIEFEFSNADTEGVMTKVCDVAQDTLVSALNTIQEFDSDSSLRKAEYRYLSLSMVLETTSREIGELNNDS